MSRFFVFVCCSVVDSLLGVSDTGADAGAGPEAVVAVDLLIVAVYFVEPLQRSKYGRRRDSRVYDVGRGGGGSKVVSRWLVVIDSPFV